MHSAFMQHDSCVSAGLFTSLHFPPKLENGLAAVHQNVIVTNEVRKLMEQGARRSTAADTIHM